MVTHIKDFNVFILVFIKEIIYCMYNMVQTPLNKIPDLLSICLYCYYIPYFEVILDIIFVSSFFDQIDFCFVRFGAVILTEMDYQLSKTLFIMPPIYFH